MTMPPKAPGSSPVVALDLARGLAALTVLFYHVRGSNWVELSILPAAQRNLATEIFFALNRFGDEAVMVFFALSGFLVGGKLIERVRAGNFDLTHYAVDRATRILIPLVPACLLTAAVAALMGHPLSGVAVLGNMIGLNGVLVRTLIYDGPLWSLAFEIWFYVLAGAIAAWIVRGGSIGVVLITAVAALSLTWLGPAFLLFWSFGALASMPMTTRKARVLAPFGLAVMISGSLCYQFYSGSKVFSTVAIAPEVVAQGMVALGFSMTLPYLCLAETNRALSRLQRPARFFSAISYSLYLTHIPINLTLNLVLSKSSTMDLNSVLTYAARIAISILFSIGFFLVFERQTGAARHALLRRLTAIRAA